MIEIRIDAKNNGQKAEKFVKKYLSNAPLSFIFKLFRKKDIKINSHWIKEDYILKENDIMQIYITKQQLDDFNKPLEIIKIKHDLDIIYEDENILVINKEAQVLVHEDKNEKVFTLANKVLAYLAENDEYRNGDVFKPSPAHRLDRNTSGVIFFGKNIESLQSLENLFKEKDNIKKFYIALVYGKTNEKGEINKSLVKNSETNEVFVSDKPYAKTAITKYRLLESFKETSLLEIQILTGRTHQIRVHMASINHPIIGDNKYGNFSYNKIFDQRFGVNYQILHSARIEFGNIEGKLSYLSGRVFEAKIPDKISNILCKLRSEL